jgi:phospholipase/carboxylesterase
MHRAVGAFESNLAALQEALSPPRQGPRPAMPEILPHIQVNQWPPAAQVAELIARAAHLQNVVVRQSRMASPDTAALALEDEYAVGPVEAFIDLPEFCHLHAPPEGGVHLTLPPAVMGAAIELGWGETHPAAQTGAVSPSLVAVYAPRDERELAAVMALVETSWRFARGRL